MKKLFGIATIIGLFCLQIASGAGAAADGKTLYGQACAGCHGPDGTGRGAAPALKGQSTEELTTKLDGYKAGTFGGAKKATMTGVVKNRGAEDMKAVVDYIGTL